MPNARFVMLAAAAALVLACAGDNAIGPNDLQVTNVPDDFEFHASNLATVTQRLTYTWQNSGTTATVDQASAITAGIVTVTIKDGSNIQVYDRDQKNTGSFDTVTGTAGSWNIQVVLSGASGTVSFHIQKKP
jgi:hypothetical protein